MFTILLGWLQRRAGAATEPLRSAREPAASCGVCGWFDSSHELQRGLVVVEPDAAAAELAAWLAGLDSCSEPELVFA
ncbi:MAG: hypothetical protein KGL43_10020 [Burkholderiales bacterium]|nr:hypothetical protein [Burkholderiales bacterium]MDE2453920.1 hypothetical protein [Burkholderiales bacterium]